jgi:hypothetical protein
MVHKYRGNRDYIAEMFAEGAVAGTTSNKTLFIDGDTIYSYGYHFPIAIVDRGRKIAYFNKDRYSHTTSCQQGVVRRELEMHGFKIVLKSTEELKSHPKMEIVFKE